MTDAIETSPTYLIILPRWLEFKHELDKLTRKAQRYGSGDIGYKVVGTKTETRKVTRFDGRKVDVTTEWVEIEVIGTAPRVGPFEFIAKVEHHTGGNLVDVAPGVEGTDHRFRQTKSACEHCDTIRNRNETFVVRNVETGEQKQIGRQCLKDYLGYESPTDLAWKFKYLRELAELCGSEFSGGRFRELWLTQDIVALSIAAVRLFGWCPGWQAGDGTTSTAGYVKLCLNPPVKVPSKNGEWAVEQNKLRQRVLDARAEGDDQTATQVIAWAVAGGAGSGDYGHNLTVLCGAELVEVKRVGMLASAYSAWCRAMERELERTKALEAKKTSAWVGAQGERLKGLRCKLVSQRHISTGQFGDTVLIKFEDEAGNQLSWFTGRGTGMQPGEKLLLDATIKAHTEYQGVKETQLTRAKVIGAAA